MNQFASNLSKFFAIVVSIFISISGGSTPVRADAALDFDKLCGNVVSNLGCSDVAAEYSVIFGSAAAAIAFAKSQGLITSGESCKADLKGHDPKLQFVLSVIDTVTGSGVGHFVNCSCDVVFSKTSCSDEVEKVGKEIGKDIVAFGKAVWGEVKKFGCSIGLGGCNNLTEEQKKSIYFSCRQFGFSEQEILNLQAFGLRDPSGKAAKNLSQSAVCFLLPIGAGPESINYYENSYQSFLSCGFHGGVAGEDPGNPKYTGYRACMDGVVCTSKKWDVWDCRKTHEPAKAKAGPTITEQKIARSKAVAKLLGPVCGIAATDPFQVSCASFERYNACLKNLGSCKSTNGVNWDDACCRLSGGGAGAPPQVKKAQSAVNEIGHSCAVNGKDPIEVDCAGVKPWEQCRTILGDCHSSNGWNWDGACCKLKGGMTNPSFEYRRALKTVSTLKTKDVRLNDSDSVEIQCRNPASYTACTKILPKACTLTSGKDYWQEACCRLHYFQ